jgi:hypothetical protein
MSRFARSITIGSCACTALAIASNVRARAQSTATRSETIESRTPNPAAQAENTGSNAQSAGAHTTIDPRLLRSARIARTEKPPLIDGKLDDPCWQLAESIGPLTQMEPLVAAPATEDTEVKLLYDDENLYIGVRCFDTEPSKIVATQMKRDAELDPDDRVEIVIDTFHDKRNAFFFQMSPAGSKGDALVSRDGQSFNKSWDGIWFGKSTIDDRGWTCELAIPFQTLSFDRTSDTWGFNINRVIKRKLESDRWSGLRQDDDLFLISSAGDVTGLDGMKQGLGLDVIPHFASNWTKVRTPESESLTGRAGFDLFYKITPSLQASFTVNTDFSETEVDDRVINLTRFPLFIPEKRDFFLQDASIFEFANLDTTLVPFFSRRIGLDADGRTVPILLGGKVTGRQDDWNIGVLDVETGASNDVGRQNLFVTRISKNVGEQSSIGGIVTSGDPNGATSSQLYGLDGTFRTSSFLGNKNFTATAWGLASVTDGSADDGGAFGASVAYPNDELTIKLAAREIGSSFDPTLGFVQRVGVREYTSQVDIDPRINTEIRRLEMHFQGDWVTDLDDRLETFTGVIRPIGVVMDSGDELRAMLLPTTDRLDADFDIQPDVVIPPGEYEFLRWRIEMESALKRPVSGTISFEAGDFYGGHRTDLDVSIAWRPSPHFNASLEYLQSDVELPGGSFTTYLGRAHVDFAFTPDITWSNFVQLDNESESLGLNSRFRWILEPGRDLFLVFNQSVARMGDVIAVSEQQAAFKLVYTLRF